MAATQPELYDLLVVTDATASMYTFLRSLHSSLQDIIRVSALTACFSRVGVLAYRDYDQSENVTQWSGWYSSDGPSEISQDELLSFVAQLQPIGGDDWREATRSGLAHAYQVMRPDARTIIVIFADAPPHTELASHEWAVEQQALAQPDSYGGAGKLFADWTSVARTLTRGEKRAHVFSIIEADRNYFCETTSMFTYLSTQSGGVCLSIPPNSTSETISKLTVCLLLSWMGAAKQGAKLDTQPLAAQARYADAGDIDQFSSEKDASAVRYLPVSSRKADRDALRANMTRSLLSLDTLAHVVPRREHAIMDFARRYKADPGYQAFVIEQLADIIQSDVAAIALNPVFGTLWRTVCNDRLQPARDKLIASFSRQLDAVEDRAKKDRLKKWLEESYDWAGEILETINSVPEEERYPCVFLDPTVRFPRAEGGEDGVNGDGANNSMEFTRDELLEIGRSCDNRILRRLGRILTRLTYVASKEELPAHIKDVPEDEVPRIPMALAKPEHHAKFWKVLLHTVLPGTMLAPRPAALLAALAVRMAIQPLEDVAYTELMAWREKWNTLDIPETWNSSCLGLLLEADKKHQQRVAGQQPGASSDGQSILKPEDRRLFEALVDYKLLEMNMDTTLSAEVGWTPHKSRVAVGPVVVCKTCQLPRSVTVMAEDGVCGLCASPCECESPEAHDALITQGLSAAESDGNLATWVECFMAECRAQYVVYNTGKLNVRPKCHYCRQKSAVSRSDPKYTTLADAPCVTCTRCANRIIWPAAYRPADFDASAYLCPACADNHPTIVTQETTARALAAQNGTAWLLRNDDNTLFDPLSGRSVFHVVSTCTTDRSLIPSHVEVLPALSSTWTTPLTLTLNNKPLHNTRALLNSLADWITTRRVQSSTAQCTLCFTAHRHNAHNPSRTAGLRLACGGRRGCAQLICEPCMRGWYGLNRPGAPINVAALACPFCRRAPVARRVALPRGLQGLAGLADAVVERGEFVYAWCAGPCGMARRLAPRTCAAGAPEVEGWRCEECVAAAEAEAAANGGGGNGKKTEDGLEVRVKMCPACGVATEKVVGCDHISCPCGAHWCFNCGKNTGSIAETYAHMTAEHHTWFADGHEEDGDEEYEEGEDEEVDEGQDGMDWV